jgi:hypothetical protein
MKLLRQLLILLWVIQEKNEPYTKPKLRRINPYNPLSYLCMIVVLVIGIALFGIIGVWKEMDFKQPFKWR